MMHEVVTGVQRFDILYYYTDKHKKQKARQKYDYASTSTLLSLETSIIIVSEKCVFSEIERSSVGFRWSAPRARAAAQRFVHIYLR